jgi:long-chain acyl-CoA synthetase
MYPGVHARTQPDVAAVVMAGSGEVRTYRELDDRSNRLAHAWRAAGLRRGDHVALLMENQVAFMDVVWAALRSGLYLTAVNSYLTPEEVAYIVGDCGASAMVTSAAKGATVAELADHPAFAGLRLRLAAGGGPDGWDPLDDVLAAQPGGPVPDESPGATMLYSSGTTGRPKGVLKPVPTAPLDATTPALTAIATGYGFRPGMTYLSPAPMYHAAPLAFVTNTQRFGGTVVMMERFDAVAALDLIERHRVTHSQWVPTMFIRMLKLPAEARRGRDLASHECAIHAAAPCPVDVKRKMIEWWGPILFEYYAGTEGNGSTAITSEEWLAHPGSVGRVRAGSLHILDEDGEELPPGESGTIYFGGGGAFEYHNDPDKTASSRDPRGRGLTTLGDVGFVDADGYLYLTDRKAFMIISGGVNVYPREVEDVLVMHPSVADVAVFGVPDDDLGEQVKAVVQAADGTVPGPALERALIAHCREHLAGFKCPKSVDFEAELPRLPTGKLYKRVLRDRYWSSPTVTPPG